MYGASRERITVDLLTLLFAGTSVAYILLTAVLRPSIFHVNPWECRFVGRAELWPFYILWHPCFAILWGGFTTVAAAQFFRLREWGRRALELVSRLALVAIPAAFGCLLLVLRDTPVAGLEVALILAFFAGSTLFALCMLIVRVLASPRMKAAMIDRPTRG